MVREQPEEIVTLKELLAARTSEGWLYDELDDEWVHCYACGHNCKIPPGRFGICRVRFNEGGQLRVPWGYVSALQLDPVEKKPFFHAFPGAQAMSFGMLGCDYHCSYCQNWITSQALRDKNSGRPPKDISSKELVSLARQYRAEIVTLIVPGFNDSDAELRAIAAFLHSVSPDIPWHVTAFHKDYKMTEPEDTSVSTLTRAAAIGYDAGLHYVYAGNIPGHVGGYENTYCPNCNASLIERWGFRVLKNRVKEGGCFECKTKIAGVWSHKELEALRGA